jgi:hypothetical protein
VEQPDYRFPFKSKNQESGLATTTTTTRKKKINTGDRKTGAVLSGAIAPAHPRKKNKNRPCYFCIMYKKKKKLLYSSASTENNQ